MIHHDNSPLNDFSTLLRRFELQFPPKKKVAQSPNFKNATNSRWCFLLGFSRRCDNDPTGRRPWGLLRRAGCSVSSTTDLILEVALDRVGFMTHDIPGPIPSMGWSGIFTYPRNQSSYSQMMSKGCPITSETHSIWVPLPFSEGEPGSLGLYLVEFFLW